MYASPYTLTNSPTPGVYHFPYLHPSLHPSLHPGTCTTADDNPVRYRALTSAPIFEAVRKTYWDNIQVHAQVCMVIMVYEHTHHACIHHAHTHIVSTQTHIVPTQKPCLYTHLSLCVHTCLSTHTHAPYTHTHAPYTRTHAPYTRPHAPYTLTQGRPANNVSIVGDERSCMTWFLYPDSAPIGTDPPTVRFVKVPAKEVCFLGGGRCACCMLCTAHVRMVCACVYCMYVWCCLYTDHQVDSQFVFSTHTYCYSLTHIHTCRHT